MESKVFKQNHCEFKIKIIPLTCFEKPSFYKQPCGVELDTLQIMNIRFKNILITGGCTYPDKLFVFSWPVDRYELYLT
jgi:hypothetical protein